MPGFGQGVGNQTRQTVGVGDDAVDDQQSMGDDEAQEDRQQDLDRLLHAAQVENDQDQTEDDVGGKGVGLGTGREQAEQGIHASGDGNGNGEHIVHQQRRAGNQPGAWTEQLRGHLVAAAAGGKQFDHLVIGQGDDEHGQEGGSGQVQAKMGVWTQGQERFGRAVAG